MLTSQAEDAEEETYGGPDQMAQMASMMLVKKACEVYTEDWQNDLTDALYARIHTHSSEEIAGRFCPTMCKAKPAAAAAKSSGTTPKANANAAAGAEKTDGKTAKAKKKKKTKPAPAAPPPGGGLGSPGSPEFNEFLQKHDTDGSLSHMMNLEKDAPEKMLPEGDQQDIRDGAPEIECAVCGVVVERVGAAAHAQGALGDEAALTDLVNDVCVRERAVEGYYPKIPGNPPQWTAEYEVARAAGTGKWALAAKAAPPVKKGKKKKGKKGKKAAQEVGSPKSYEEHQQIVKRDTMISLACKGVVQEQTELDLTELLFDSRGKAAPLPGTAKVQAKYCWKFCGEGKAQAADEL